MKHTRREAIELLASGVSVSAAGCLDSGEERLVDFVDTHPALETLHVWVHEENPEGLFAPVSLRFVDAGDGDHGGDHDH